MDSPKQPEHDSDVLLPRAEELLKRARGLLFEIETFVDHWANEAKSYLSHERGAANGAVGPLPGLIKSEIGGIEGVVKRLKSNIHDEAALHSISSSNTPFFEALWSFAKQSQNIIALRKPVCNGNAELSGETLLAPGVHVVQYAGDSPHSKLHPTLVDIVANNGRTWVKVCAITAKRFIWDMTNLGLAVGLDEEHDDEDDLDDLYDGLPVYDLAKGLAKSANVYWIRNHHPEVRLVLPRISRTRKEFSQALDAIAKLGVQVLCSEDLDEQTPSLSDDTLRRMVPAPLSEFSDALNMDASVLMALISDFSHGDLEIPSWFSSHHRNQAEAERKRKILPVLMYPAMGQRELICTKEAAETCNTIVTTIGTDTEIARMKLLFTQEGQNAKHENVLQEWAKLSGYEVPPGLRLPVRVIDRSSSQFKSSPLPDLAQKTLEEVTEPTRSVFEFGWATGLTTLTSNATGVSSFTRSLEDLRETYDGPWPSIWVCPSSRSLVGVPKSMRQQDGSDGTDTLIENT